MLRLTCSGRGKTHLVPSENRALKGQSALTGRGGISRGILKEMFFCSFNSTSFGQRVFIFSVAAEFNSIFNIFVLHPRWGCCFSLGAPQCNWFHSRCHHNIGGLSISRYSISTLFCSAECYKSINQVMLHNNHIFRCSPVLANNPFFRLNLCTTRVAFSCNIFFRLWRKKY